MSYDKNLLFLACEKVAKAVKATSLFLGIVEIKTASTEVLQGSAKYKFSQPNFEGQISSEMWTLCLRSHSLAFGRQPIGLVSISDITTISLINVDSPRSYRKQMGYHLAVHDQGW